MLNFFKVLLAFVTAGLIVGTATVAGLFWHFSHGLPDHKTLADYQPATVSRLYAADGRLLAEYAREKRVFVPVAAMPKRLLEAFVAAEDQRFFTHPGIDFIGVVRAVIANLSHPGQRPEGASGITQQVAKNFLLTNQATLARKIREAILAFRIEDTYSKERILELYLNEIYLGSGNYGVAQAAINYFDRSLGELSLSQIAYLAGLPKAPNRYNIVRNEKEAYARRDYVLGRMLDDSYITAAEAQQARAEKLQLRRRGPTEIVQADFFAEEVRRNLLAAYGEKGLYEGGLTVSTTLDPAFQAAADNALRAGLIVYDRRHGWRGPYAKIADMSAWEEDFARIAQRRPLAGPAGWQLAVVTKVDPQSVSIAGLPDDGENSGANAGAGSNAGASSGTNSGTGTVPFAEMTWARPTLANQTVGGAPGRPANVVSVGDVIVVEKVDKPDGANAKPYPPKTYALRQVPNVEGGVVVMDTQTGRVLAMSGGWSYGRSQFNRAVQASRQPGSAFKPFVYLAAMDSGLTPASIGLDEAFSYDPGRGQPVWSPKNYGGDYMGPMTLQRALELSRNLVTVRVAQQVGMKKVAEVAKEFGVIDNLGLYLPLALGAGDTTLLRMTMAYAMLANGALEITPSLVDRVQDRNGKTIYRHEPRACVGCGEQTGPKLVAARDRRFAPAFPRPGLGLPGRAHAAGRHDARHGGPARGARPADRRQDRHDQRRARQLVHGRDARHHGRHLCRLRRAAHARCRQPRDGQRQRGTDLRPPRPRDLQGQAADAVPHPARPAPGQVELRRRHDRRGLQARHRARLGRLQPGHDRRLDGRRLGRRRLRRQPPSPGPFRHGRDVLNRRPELNRHPRA